MLALVWAFLSFDLLVTALVLVLAYLSWSWAYHVGHGMVVVVLVGAGAGSGLFTRALVNVHAHAGLFTIVLVSVRAVTHAAAAYQSDVKWLALIPRAGTVCPLMAVLTGIGGRTAATHTLAVVLNEDGRGWWWNHPCCCICLFMVELTSVNGSLFPLVLFASSKLDGTVLLLLRTLRHHG